MDCNRNRSTEYSVRVAGTAVRRRLPRDDRPMIKVATNPFRQSDIRELGARQSVTYPLNPLSATICTSYPKHVSCRLTNLTSLTVQKYRDKSHQHELRYLFCCQC